MQKLLAFILLASSLLFFKRGNSVTTGVQGQHNGVVSLNKAAVADNAILQNGKSSKEYLLQLSFLIDENDDDECSSVKKRVTVCNNSIFVNNIFTGDNPFCFLKPENFHKHFSYPSLQRYILHRVIII
jgi:hypothetical protein